MKNIFIVNGFPTSGKGEFVNICKDILRKEKGKKGVIKTSIIDATKDLAYDMGLWDGGKTPVERAFLSDLKDALDKYCYYSFDVLNNYIQDETITTLFVDMRSPYDITRACKDWAQYGIVTPVLIKRTGVDEEQEYSNHADEQILRYNYEYIVENNDSIEKLKETAHSFLDLFY